MGHSAGLLHSKFGCRIESVSPPNLLWLWCIYTKMQLSYTGPFSTVRRIGFICDLYVLECKLLLVGRRFSVLGAQMSHVLPRKPQNQIDFVYSSRDMSPLSWHLTELYSECRRRKFSLRIWSSAHMALRIRPIVLGRTIELPALFGHWALDVCM